MPMRKRALQKEESLMQTTLDFGQKNVGLQKCSTCQMYYNLDDVEDSVSHQRFHKRMITPQRASLAWKNQFVLEDMLHGKIIYVSPDDRTGLQRFEAIRHSMDGELGQDSTSGPGCNIYLFLGSTKKEGIIGCCIAEQISKAHRIIITPDKTSQKEDELSKESSDKKESVELCPSILIDTDYPVTARCGIRRLWVASPHRRKGIAKALIEAVRGHIIYGFYVPKEQIAFTDPTPDGRNFASNFIGRSDFLVY